MTTLAAETFVSHSPEETTEFGRRLAARLHAPALVLLSGELGAGKTTLTKGIISGLGAAREEDVTSPTFTMVHVFQAKPSAGRNAAETMAPNGAPNMTPDAAQNMTPSAAEKAAADSRNTSSAPSGAGPNSSATASSNIVATPQTGGAPGAKVFHVDLYRVEEFRELETLALEDALAEPAIVIVEWSDKFSLRSEWPRIVVQLEHADGDTRRITVERAVENAVAASPPDAPQGNV